MPVRGKAIFKNLRFRQWDMSPCPPLNAANAGFDPQAAIDWFTKALKLDPDQSYYAWRISMAYFNLKQFEKAAQFAKQARELGMPACRTCLMEGYVHDIAGDYETAINHYQNFDSGRDQIYDINYYSGVRLGSEALPRDIAAAWYVWLKCMYAQPNDDPAGELKLDWERWRHWSVDRIRDTLLAHQGKFRDAELRLSHILKYNKAPVEFHERLQEQIDSYKDGKPWAPKEGSKPFYHEIDLPLGPQSLGVGPVLRH